MTETEKKLASNASLLTGVTMLVAMPFWFEIIVVSDQNTYAALDGNEFCINCIDLLLKETY